MGATFPNGIASFSPKRNLLDDVDANDINKMQDEIVAIQSVLGPLVNEVDEIQAEVDQNEAGDDIAEVQIRNLRTSYKSLSDQLAAIRAGLHTPVFQSIMLNATIPSVVSSKPWLRIKFPKPAVDTHRGYSGYGFYRAPRTGFYFARAQINWDSGPAGAAALGFGTYSAYLNVGGQVAGSIDRKEHSLKPALGVHLSPYYLGWVKRGSSIAVYVNQNSGKSARIYSAFMSAIMLRDMEPQLVNLGFEGPLPRRF